MRARDGFSLLEVLVALMISGIGVTIAATVFITVSQVVESLQSRASHAARESEGLLWLREGLLAVDVALDTERWFIGSADRVSFTAWLPSATGWTEIASTVASLEGGRLTVRSGASTYVLPDSLAYAAFDYLGEYGADSPWLVQWESGTGAPLALRLRRGRIDGTADTTLLYVGRGR